MADTEAPEMSNERKAHQDSVLVRLVVSCCRTTLPRRPSDLKLHRPVSTRLLQYVSVATMPSKRAT